MPARLRQEKTVSARTIKGLFVQVDVEFGSDDKIVEVSVDAEHVFLRCLLFSKRALNDGAFTAAQVRRECDKLDRIECEKASDELIDIGLWVGTETGFQIVGWTKRNKTKAALQAEADAAHAAALKGNHKRWHTGKDGTPSEDCEYCQGNPSSVGDPIGGATGTRSGHRKRGRSPETETETETETYTSATSNPKSEPVDNGGGKLTTIEQAHNACYAKGWTQNELEQAIDEIHDDPNVRNEDAVTLTRLRTMANTPPPGTTEPCPACDGNSWAINDERTADLCGRCQGTGTQPANRPNQGDF